MHTKFFLIDPLSARPVVVTGSGNLSRASVRTNDENMLVLRGAEARRVARLYLVEFLRVSSCAEEGRPALHTAYAVEGRLAIRALA